jgi:outer membrane lipoprotein-sorting protein
LTAAAVLGIAGCGAPLMKLPAGPGQPAPDAADALAQATAVCRGVRTLTAEIGATGKAAGARFRGRLSVGVAAPASARIEAVAPFGAPIFIFVATGDDATLLLPRDNRVLAHGRPAEVLDAVAGVPLDAADLHATLTGCVPALSQPQGYERGPDWRVLTDAAAGHEVYLHRGAAAGPWQIVAVVRRPAAGSRVAWRAEYRDHQNGLPRSARLASIDAGGAAAFDLTLVLSQVETNVPLEPDVFRVQIPASAESITLDELRHARPGVRED